VDVRFIRIAAGQLDLGGLELAKGTAHSRVVLRSRWMSTRNNNNMVIKVWVCYKIFKYYILLNHVSMRQSIISASGGGENSWSGQDGLSSWNLSNFFRERASATVFSSPGI